MDEQTDLSQVSSDKCELHNIHSVDWARLAAFIDGEGSICRNNEAVQVQVTNSKIPLMEWLVSTFGGNYSTITSAVKRHQHMWYPYGRKFILQGILPYLIIEKQQAAVALAIYEVIPEGKRKGSREIPMHDRLVRMKLLEMLDELNKPNDTVE